MMYMYVYEDTTGSPLPLVTGCRQWVYSCIAIDILEADKLMREHTKINPLAPNIQCYIEPVQKDHG